MKTLHIKDGSFALVDDDDYIRLAQYRWTRIGHYARRTNGEHGSIYLHHDILGRPPKGLEVDHINRNALDNQKCNLRFVTSAQNQQNRRRGKTSQFLGVCYHCGPKVGRKKWQAMIRHAGVSYRLGQFLTEEEAAKAYDKKALELYGDLATLNFLRGVTPARLPVSAPAPPPVAQPLAALPSPAAANSGGV